MQKILSDNKKTFLFFLILSLLFYGNAIKNNYSLDDNYVTVTNYPVTGKSYTPNNALVAGGIKNIPTIWRSHYGHDKGVGYDYRPLVITMFAIEYTIWGQAPHIDHFINILIYATIVFCFFLLLKQCLNEYGYKELFAFVCAVLFLAHPIHTEPVNNIKCRDELLALLFALLAAIQIITYYELKDKRVKYLIYGGLFMFLALYCKLTAALFMALIPLLLLFFIKIDKKQIAFISLGFFICYFIFKKSKKLLITEKTGRFFFHFENPLYTEHISFYARVLFVLKTFATYVKLLLFPYPLRFYYGSSFSAHVNLLDFEIILSLIFLVLAFYYCYKKKDKIALCGLLVFLISIGPITNILQPVAGVVGERLCLTASIGFMMFITAVSLSFYKTIPTKITTGLFTQKPLLYVSGIVLLFLFCTWNRNAAWESDFSLYEHDAQYSEKSSGVNNLLGNKYFEMLSSVDKKYTQKELIDKALKHYKLAIQDDSTMYSAFNNAGVIYFSYLNQPDVAFGYFMGAICSKRDYAQAYENIGNYYRKQGDFIQAFKNYRMATLYNPKQYKSYTELISMLIEKNNFIPAYPIIKEADANFSKDYFITSQYANYFLMTGKNDIGMQKLEEAYRIYPNKKLAKYLFEKYYEHKDMDRVEYYRNQYAVLQQ